MLFKFSHNILDWTVLSWNFFFLDESVDLIIYRDYNSESALFFYIIIYCSLATQLPTLMQSHSGGDSIASRC